MNKRFLTVSAIALAATLSLTAASCDGPGPSDRDKSAAAAKPAGETLEIKNLKAKRAKEESPDATRYLYLMSFGKIIGYYVTKGKISSNGSQIGPELESIGSYSAPAVVDSAQDDGSYGDGDPGIFFFTSDGTMVVTDLDYIQSDAPLPIDVPRLTK